MYSGMQESGIALSGDKLTTPLTRKDIVTILQRVNPTHRRKLKSSFQFIKQPEPITKGMTPWEETHDIGEDEYVVSGPDGSPHAMENTDRRQQTILLM